MKTMTQEGKDKLVESTVASIEKKFGPGSVFMGAGNRAMPDVSRLSTGSIGLDFATSLGGVPRGRIVEIYGPEASGKTTICLSIVAQAQLEGGYAAFVDMEHALDPAWAQRIGVNMERFAISQPDTGEQALDVAEEFIRSTAFSVVVIDSVAALAPKAEIEGEMSDSHVGLQARLMGKALRKMTGLVKETNTVVIFTNQLRTKIGVSFGSPETTPGGKALPYYASQRFDIRRTETLKNGTAPIGNRTKVTVKKNKVGIPFQVAEFDIVFGVPNEAGISVIGEIIDLGVKLGIISKRGAYFSYGEGLSEWKEQGREKARSSLLSNQALAFQIHNEILRKLGMKPLAVMPNYGDPTFNPSTGMNAQSTEIVVGLSDSDDSPDYE